MKQVLHLPQYLSWRVHGQIRSEHTSVGCHTAMWDFDNMAYHAWLKAEGITLPPPSPVEETLQVPVGEGTMAAGIGIHDSSASLVPYLKFATEKFILVSTGTWCITMNPFNGERLSQEELSKDCLCFLSARQKPVKSSRFFLGRIHDTHVELLEQAFGMEAGSHKTLVPRKGELENLAHRERRPVFFADGIPDGWVDDSVDPRSFRDFHSAYASLMADLCRLAVASIRLVIPSGDDTRHLYISGGFARNPYFTGLISRAFPHKEVYTSRVDNATSLGAALVIYEQAWGRELTEMDLGLKATT
jgi:sugar (pentulose or hexulose) kinase